MRKLILTITLSFAFLFLSAQEMHKIDVKWGNELKIKKGSTIEDILATTKDGIYVLKKVRKGAVLLRYKKYIEFYDKNLNFKKAVELELEYKGKEMDLEYTTFMNGKLYFYSSFKNQKTKKFYLFSQSINLKTLLPNKDLKKISEIDYAGHSRWNSGDYSFDFSSDSSKFLVSYKLPYDKNENEKFGFHMFDSGMNLLWEKDITLPFAENLFEIKKIKVDYKGDAYLIGRLYKEKARVYTRGGSPNFRYHILAFQEKGTEINEYEAKLKDKFITDMQIDIAPNDDIICAGFYSNTGTYAIKGSFYLSIDAKTKNIKKSSLKEFGMDFITQTMTQRQEKKAKKREKKGKEVEMYDYDLDEMIMRSDGGVMLIAEQYDVHVSRITTTNAQGVTTTSTTYYYYYNDIIVVNISPQGNIDWAITIPKYQMSTNDGGFYSSYVLSIVDDKLYFVFNDNPKNLNYKKGDRMYYPIYGRGLFSNKEGAALVIVCIDSKGNLTRKALLTQSDSEVITRPKVCQQIGNNELIIYGQKRKKQKFARVVFE